MSRRTYGRHYWDDDEINDDCKKLDKIDEVAQFLLIRGIKLCVNSYYGDQEFKMEIDGRVIVDENNFVFDMFDESEQ